MVAMFRRAVITCTCLLLLALPLWAQTPAPPGQGGFVPLDSMPQKEQIPAAPLLLSSYAFFLVLMLFYLWTIWQRLGRVEKEMRDLERRQGAVKR